MSRPRVEQLYPLSPAQRGLLVQELAAPAAGHYIVQVVATLRGSLDRDAFEAAWRLVQSRHDALRSSFAWESIAEPLQVVHRDVPLPLTWTTASGAEWLDTFLSEQRRRGVPLRRAPLFSVTVAEVDSQSWHFVWCYHHLLLDGWSSAIILRELFTAYATRASGAGVTLPPPVSYSRYVSWLQAQDVSAAERFWRGHLAGAPVGRARRSVETPAPGSCARLVSPQQKEAIDALLRRERVTTATLVHGLWALLLARRAGVDDVTFGSVVAGRPETLEGADHIVGSLINVLPIRVRLERDQSVGEWLRTLQRDLLEARRHGSVPIGRIAQWVGHAGAPLFDTLLTVENYPDALWHSNPAGAMLQVERMRVIESTDYPLTLEAVPAQRLLLQVLFDRHRLPSDSIEHLLVEAETVIDALTESGQRLGAVLRPPARPAGPAQRHANDTLVTRFASTARLHADAVAVECDGASLTYAELAERADGISAALCRLGIATEDRVALLLERSPDAIAAMLGVLQAGGCYVPVEPSTPADRLALLLADAGVRIVVTVSALAPRVASAVCLLLDQLATDDRVTRAAAQDVGDEAPRPAAVHPDQAAYVIYTSGSTGRPKGVVVSHRNVVRLFDATATWLGPGPGDVWTLFHAFAFDFSVWEIFGALLHGGRLIVVPWVTSRSPEEFVTLLVDRGVTVLSQTPSAFKLLVSHLADPRTPPLPALRLVVFGGEALPFDVLAPFVARAGNRARLVNMYGITETTVHVTQRPIDPVDTVLVQGSHIGVPLADLAVRLLDSAGAPVPDGQSGEICVAGPGLARGYLGDPRLTAQRFVPDPCADIPGARLYRSGDLARRLPNGDLEYLGRADRQLKVRGYRIEPGEIEAALRAHAAVDDAVVVLQHDGAEAVLAGHIVPATPSATPVRRIAEAAAANPARAICELPNGIAVFHQQASATLMMYDEIFGHASYLRHGVTIADGDCVFDVGANIGLFSLFAATAAKDVRVFAFEPMPEVFELLAENCRCHDVAGQALNVALGAREGEETLTYFPHVSVVSGSVDPAVPRVLVESYLRHRHGAALEQQDLDALLEDRLTSRTVTSQMRRLSNARRALGVERIDLLKIDVEGSEEAVLDGIDAADWPLIRQVVLEVHGDGMRDRIVARLGGLGFATTVEQQDALRDTGMWTVAARSSTVARPSAPVRHGTDPVWRSPERLMQALRAHLESRLPAHMLPHALAPIGCLPLTANGKIDRRALPPVRQTAASPHDDRAPRSETERVLGGIWCELLTLPAVPRDGNFFELGGDSIIAVQMVARSAYARQLRITPSAGGRAPHARARLTAEARPQAAGVTPGVAPSRSGRVPLTPVQQWFFEQRVPNRAHWNQAVLFEIANLPPRAVEAGLRAALSAHDVFALRFTRHDDGWRQEYGTPPEAEPRLPVFPVARTREVAESLHRALDIGRGPLLRAALFLGAEGDKPRLLLVAHHLVMDAFSWRILVEDIITAARDAAEGRTPIVCSATRPRSCSWSGGRQGGAADDGLEYRAAPCHGQLELTPPRLPRDMPSGVASERSLASVSRVLPPDETTALDERLARRAGMGTSHVLLAAVSSGLSQWMNGGTVRIDVESHGRDAAGELDMSRTVGWFTGIAPVVLPVGEAQDIPGLLRMVKDALSMMPRPGQAYGLLRYLAPPATRAAWSALPGAEVIFNFHGRVGGAPASHDGLRLLDSTAGPLHDPDAQPTHLIVVEASIDERGLAITWSYSRDVHAARTIERLASNTMATLRRMLALAAADRVLVLAPADYELAGLQPGELAAIVALRPDAEDIYPLSPAQQGIFFHALFDPASTVYFTQFHWTMEGELNVEAFWRELGRGDPQACRAEDRVPAPRAARAGAGGMRSRVGAGRVPRLADVRWRIGLTPWETFLGPATPVPVRYGGGAAQAWPLARIDASAPPVPWKSSSHPVGRVVHGTHPRGRLRRV